jgi:APA family basic amino acid/polyamine antiporter
MHLILLGVGSTVGAGIYVMTGVASGPTMPGLPCCFRSCWPGWRAFLRPLSYAELASLMPVAGSAYTYAYVSLGEGCAWAVGWLLLLEYGISCAGVASGLSGYLVSLLHDFGVLVPQALSTTTIQVVDSAVSEAVHVGLRLGSAGGGVHSSCNLCAAGGRARILSHQCRYCGAQGRGFAPVRGGRRVVCPACFMDSLHPSL